MEMSSLVARHVICLGSPRAEPFRARSIGLCLAGHHILASLAITDFRSQIPNLKFVICNPVGVVPAHFRARPSAAFERYLLMSCVVEISFAVWIKKRLSLMFHFGVELDLSCAPKSM